MTNSLPNIFQQAKCKISWLLATVLMTSMAWANPEINVLGRGFAIPSGNAGISVQNGTDFGVVTAGVGMVKNVFVIANGGFEPNATLTIQEVSVDAPQFLVSILPQSSVPKDGVTSFEVTYRPLSVGTHNATVTIRNNDADESTYTFAIRGIGKSPEIQVSGLDGLNINTGDTSPSTNDGTDFGTRSVNQIVEREFRISNSGEVDLDVSSIQISSGPFSVVQSPTAPIAPGGNGSFTIRYQPTEIGSRSATVSIINNDLDETVYTFLVRGNADAPEIELSHNSVNISSGSLTPASGNGTLIAPVTFKASRPSRSFVVRNSGTGSLLISQVILSDSVNFAVTTPLPGVIVSNSFSNLVIEYNPATPGDHTCIVEIRNNDLDEATYRFAVRATSLAPGGGFGLLTNGDTTPSDAEGTHFGDGIIGAPPIVRTFPIANAGPGEMILSSVTVAPNSQFSLPLGTTFPIIIPAGTSFQLPIQYRPTSLGAHQATVTIRSNDLTNDPFAFDVAGRGNTREIVVGSPGFLIARGDMTPSVEDGTNLEFGDVGAMPRKQTVIPVKNNGNFPLTINSVMLSDSSNFTIASNITGALAPGASKNLVIEFSPQSGGLKTSSVTINSNEPGSPFAFGIQGFARTVINFGQSLIGGPPVVANQPFTNMTASPITVQGVTIVPSLHFVYTGPPAPFELQPGQTIQLPVSYAPTSPGDHSAIMTVRTSADGAGEPASFRLFGSSSQRLLVVGAVGKRILSGDTTPAVEDDTNFGKVIAGFGKTIIKSWPLTNDGNVPLVISSVQISNTTDFSITSMPAGTLAAENSTTLGITFLPRSPEVKECVVTIVSNDPRSPFTFAISADGSPRVDTGGPLVGPPVLNPVPWNPSYAGPYSVLIATPDADGRATTPYEGGFDSFVVRPDGSFTASGSFLDQNIAIKGIIGPDGRYEGSTTLPDGTVAQIRFQTFIDTDGTARIIGTLLHNGKTWVIDGVLALTGNIPSNMIGNYTFVIPGAEENQAGAPTGDCAATATLRIDGRFTIKCRLADTNIITFTSTISPRFQWIFWRRISGNIGYLSGAARFRDIPEVSDFDGHVQWFKRPAAGQRYFSSGFSVTRPLIGNFYRAPARNRTALSDLLVTGANNALFQLGTPPQGVSDSPKLVNWTSANKIVYAGPEKLKLKVATSTGRITGKFSDSVSKSNVTIDAVMLQKQNRVAGLLYNYGISGYVSIIPRQYTGY